VTHREEMSSEEGWRMHIPEEKKKAFMKAKMDYKLKKAQAKLEFLKEIQRIFD
jgi:hypothetical protein